MRRLFLAAAACVAANTVAFSGEAATVINTGVYAGGENSYTGGSLLNLPFGNYLIEFKSSSSLVLMGDVATFIEIRRPDGSWSGGTLLQDFRAISPAVYNVNFSVLPSIDPTYYIDRYYYAYFSSATSGRYTVSLSLVPEPATWALMIFGFGVTGASWRRRTLALKLAAHIT